MRHGRIISSFKNQIFFIHKMFCQDDKFIGKMTFPQSDAKKGQLINLGIKLLKTIM